MITSALARSIEQIASNDQVPWDSFRGSIVVVSGATGLVGSQLVKALLQREEERPAGMKIVALVRNIDRACEVLGNHDALDFCRWDASEGIAPSLEEADYVIHCAAPTASTAFVERPVDTIDIIVNGTRSLLDLCRVTGAHMCYVSSMEVYGAGSDEPLTEDAGGAMDSMNPRSSYPEAKQLAEALCAGYGIQFGVPVCVARLAQTFGAGVPPTDNRVFSEFARDCIEGHDITLLTDGSKQNMYVAIADAVTALLLLVVKGQGGTAYNVANEETLCSVRQMSEAVASRFGQGRVHVVVKIDFKHNNRYPENGTIRLDTTRLRSLGWTPTTGLMDMYGQLIADWTADGC